MTTMIGFTPIAAIYSELDDGRPLCALDTQPDVLHVLQHPGHAEWVS